MAGLQGTATNTMTGMSVQDQYDQLNQALLAAAQQQQQAAGQASQEAQSQYQQAAAQPPPTLSAADTFLPTLLSNIASVIGQNPSYREHTQESLAQQRKDLISNRLNNLTALRDNMLQKANLAEKAGDSETALATRLKTDQLDKQMAELHLKQQEDFQKQQQADRLQTEHQNRLAEDLAKSKLGPSPEDIQATYDNSARTDMAGNRYIDVGQFKGKDVKAIQAEAARRGDLALTTPQSNVLTKIDDAKQNIKTVYDSVASFAPKDFLGRPVKAAQIKWSQLVQSNPEAAAYSALQLSAINNIVAIAGGAGSGVRVNEAEIRRSIANDMPRPTDTLPVALRKTQHMDTMLEHLRNTVTVRNRSTLSGGVQQPATGGKVVMTDPNGKRFEIDAAEVKDAVSHGWKRSQ